MSANLAPLIIQQFFDNNGRPLAQGLLYTYQAGTTTPKATYTDFGGLTPNTNPIVLNARGEASIWITPGQSYKFLLQDWLGNTIPGWPRDNISSDSGLSASLALSSGASIIGADDGASGLFWNTNQGALDTFDVKFANYTALRAYTGTRHVTCRITAAGIAGFFYYDSTDVTSADNGGTIIVDASGRRWKRFYDGVGDFAWFGADTTGATSCASAVIAALATNIQSWKATRGTYNFGTITGDTYLITLTQDKVIDWNGSDLVCAGQNTSAFTGTYLIVASDCRLSMWNFTFDDTAFTFAGPSRGVVPIGIASVAASVSGYSFGNYKVLRGQSLLTVGSSNPALYRASNIRFFGQVYGGSVYYGVALSNNGDDFEGSYHVDTVNRLAFVYGVNSVKIKATANTGNASSANINISCYSASYPTKNIDIDAYIQTIGGPAIVCAVSTGASGTFESINIKYKFDAVSFAVGNPVFTSGTFTAGGAYDTSEQTISANRISIELIYPDSIGLTDPVKVYTPSVNYGLYEIKGNTKFLATSMAPKDAGGVYKGPTIKYQNAYCRSVAGDLTNVNAIISIPSKYLSNRNKATTLVAGEVVIHAANAMSAAKNFTLARYSVTAYLDSSGLINNLTATKIFQHDASATVPVFTLAASAGSDALNITATAYTAATAFMVAEYKQGAMI